MSSDSLRRLSTFAEHPIPSEDRSGIRAHFASKASGAYFERSPECVKDEVLCRSCGVTFGDWDNEFPSTVHRVISPKCPKLSPAANDNDDSSTSATLTRSADSSWNYLEEGVLECLRDNPYCKYLPEHIRQRFEVDPVASEIDCRTPDQVPHARYDPQMVRRVRRQLFPDSDSEDSCPSTPPSYQTTEENSGTTTLELSEIQRNTSSSLPQGILSHTPISHPFPTKCGGYDALFASHRFQTFPGSMTTSSRYQAWAEEGFVFREEKRDVKCVFCGTVLVLNGHQPSVAHRQACATCPFVLGFDVGNVSQQQEKDITLKYYKQQAAKNKTEFPQLELVVKYPQYQKSEDRLGTFQGWPEMCAKSFPPDVLASAGFYYSGFSDKVTCYSCGVELCKWAEGAEVWKTHARVSPTCFHLIQHREQDFMDQAAGSQVLVEVKYPKEISKGSVSGRANGSSQEPGSPRLDWAAVKAAHACGYTMLQIQLAIVKFFCQTSRYPNTAILKASLKAADENHLTICKQQVAIHHTVAKLQEKDTVIHETKAQLHEKDTVIHKKDTQLQQKDTMIHEKDTVIREKDSQLHRVIQEKDQRDNQLADTRTELTDTRTELTDTRTELTDTRTELAETQARLSEKDMELGMLDQQVQALMRQVQQLRADRQPEPEVPPVPVPAPAQPEDNMERLRAQNTELRQSLMCKICMSDKPRMIFLPCGHLFSCAECTSRLPDRRCPVCRQDISQVLPAFVA